MFIYMQKTNFIIHFFLEILHFKESCNLIGWQHRELEFCQIWDWWWNINNNISFQFRLYTRKTNGKFFKKSQKSLFGGHFGPFLPKFGQQWIFLEKRAVSFYIFQLPITVPKIRKSYWAISEENTKLADSLTNWQTDRQRDNGDFTRPSVASFWGLNLFSTYTKLFET